MGHLKHVFGDDMNPDEKARLDHAELVEVANAHGQCLTSRALWKHHDRKYGVRTLCAWCNEPALDRIADAFARPCAEPMRPQPGAGAPLPVDLGAIVAQALRERGFGDIVVRNGSIDANGNFKLSSETEKRHDHNV